MSSVGVQAELRSRLVDSLYVEAMLLADEARTYFDEGGRLQRDALSPLARVEFSCESLKVTTRLMHVIAWLLNNRAVAAGELSPREMLDPTRRLGPAPFSDPATITALPEQASALISASMELYRRVSRLDDAQLVRDAPPSPARSMLQQLASSL